MFAALLIAGSIIAAVPGPQSDRERAAELVALLGDASYKVREKASDDLIRLGSAALEPLRRGLTNPDTEIGERCRKLLPLALDHHLQEQIEVFLAKPNHAISPDLPGINRWIKMAGTGKESRELYALLIKEQRKLLIDIERTPDKAAQYYQSFLTDMYNRTRVSGADARKELVSYSELVLFLFLGADPNCRKSNGAVASTSYIQSNLFLNSTHLAGMLSGAGSNHATRQIFLGWLEQERYSILVRRGCQLAATANMKEAIPIVIRMANDKTAIPTTRSYPLLGAMKLFGPEDIKHLEGLMEDKTVIGRTTVNNEAVTTEMRDIALGIAVQASGQKPADYGFDRLRDNIVSTSYFYYAISDKKREEAHKKWADWQAAQKSKR